MEDKKLAGVDESRRAALRKMVAGGAFVVPFVASYAMSGLSASAQFQSTLSPGTGTPGPVTTSHTPSSPSSPSSGPVTTTQCFQQTFIGSIPILTAIPCPPGVTPGTTL